MKPSLQILMLAFLTAFECSHPTQMAGGGDEVTTGRLYYQNGSFAAHCQVIAVPSNGVPGSGSLSQFETVTDSLGQYSFNSVPEDTYNIYGKKDTLASYLEAVELGNFKEKYVVPNDTLKPIGGISGIVRLSASPDSRIVLILMIGGTMISWPDDGAGHFSITDLAEGSYQIRFLATDSRYQVLDTSFSVKSGQNTDVGTILLTIPMTQIQ
jgi:hypothetical protein